MKIGPHNSDEHTLVIAELGNNHEGDPAVARALIDAAAAAGAHAVKLQVFEPRWYVAPTEPERIAQLEMFRLSHDTIAELADVARAHSLGVVATAFDLKSADVIEPLVDAIKIASGDNDVDPLLERAAASGKPVVVSTGMSSLDGIARAKTLIEDRWDVSASDAELALLHCVSAYPTPPDSASLASIPLLRQRFGCTVGYSDHTLGIDACTAAVAAGARILEKHFTLSHEFSDFRDHQLSAEPDELRELVERVNQVDELLGEPRDAVLEVERDVRVAARRSLRAGRDLSAGHRVDETDLTWLRPLEGLSPRDSESIVGRKLVRDLKYGEPVTLQDVE